MKSSFEAIYRGAMFLYGHPRRWTILNVWEYSRAQAQQAGVRRAGELAAAVVIKTFQLAAEAGLDYRRAAQEFRLAIEAREWALEMLCTAESAAALAELRREAVLARVPGFRLCPVLVLERVLSDYQKARGGSRQRPLTAGDEAESAPAEDALAPGKNSAPAPAHEPLSSL